MAEDNLDAAIEELPFGGTSYDLTGLPLSDEAKRAALASDAVLMGAVGGPQWKDIERDKRPEAGLLKLRTELDVFANLRPAYCFDALAEAGQWVETEAIFPTRICKPGDEFRFKFGKLPPVKLTLA